MVEFLHNRIFYEEFIMTLEEITLELELAGVSRDKQVKLLSSVQREGFDAKALDKKLMLMGFEPVFSIYDDEEDDSKD